MFPKLVQTNAVRIESQTACPKSGPHPFKSTLLTALVLPIGVFPIASAILRLMNDLAFATSGTPFAEAARGTRADYPSTNRKLSMKFRAKSGERSVGNKREPMINNRFGNQLRLNHQDWLV